MFHEIVRNPLKLPVMDRFPFGCGWSGEGGGVWLLTEKNDMRKKKGEKILPKEKKLRNQYLNKVSWVRDQKFEVDIKVNFFYPVQSSYIGIDRKSFDQISHSGRDFPFISI